MELARRSLDECPPAAVNHFGVQSLVEDRAVEVEADTPGREQIVPLSRLIGAPYALHPMTDQRGGFCGWLQPERLKRWPSTRRQVLADAHRRPASDQCDVHATRQ
jgi:hypothetical protein